MSTHELATVLTSSTWNRAVRLRTVALPRLGTLHELSCGVQPRCTHPRCTGDFDFAHDHMLTAVSADGSISAKAVVTTKLVDEGVRLQGLRPLAAAALGRAMSCSLLVAEGLKEDETFQVSFPKGPSPGWRKKCLYMPMRARARVQHACRHLAI